MNYSLISNFSAEKTVVSDSFQLSVDFERVKSQISKVLKIIHVTAKRNDNIIDLCIKGRQRHWIA